LEKDPTATESYIALRNALVAIQDDPSAVRSILSSLSDAGAGWVETAYSELRNSLVQGRLKEAERIGSLIGVILGVQDHGMDDELSENRIHNEAMNWIIDGIEAILAQDNRTGISHLERLTEAVYSNESMQWVAWYWLAKAASDEGNLEMANRAAVEAMELAENLDLRSRSMSLCRSGEIEFLRGESEVALERLIQATTTFREIGDRRGMSMAFLTLARMLFSLARQEEGLQAANRAQEADPEWDEPAVFLSQRALMEGEMERADILLSPFFSMEPRSPAVERQRQLIMLVRAQEIPLGAVSDYLRLRERPANADTVQEMETLRAQFPGFVQLREAMAWNLIKIGREDEAAEHFQAMAYLDLDPEIQSSVLLGLGCLANRQFKHRQPSARVRATASAAAQPSKVVDSDEDVEPSDEENGEIPVIEALPAGYNVPEVSQEADEGFSSIEDALDASSGLSKEVKTQETIEAHGGDDALEASFEFSVGVQTAEAGEAIQLEAEPEAPPQLGEGPSMGGDKVEAKAVFTGELQLFAVPDLLDFLNNSRRTGTLVITSESGIGAVHMAQGLITGAASPNSANLGDLLMEKSAITEDQLQTAVDRQRSDSPDRLLGSILVEMDLVERAMLQQTLTEQVKGALREMVQWIQGRFAFEPDKRREEEPDDSDVEIQLDTRGLLLDVLREHDEANK
jgi:tetratricopeptide (TPR) repeat protein